MQTALHQRTHPNCLVPCPPASQVIAGGFGCTVLPNHWFVGGRCAGNSVLSLKAPQEILVDLIHELSSLVGNKNVCAPIYVEIK